ncbi:MAG: poly-beta-1,6-N-acetyl-D-glucosamine biosynthesis protein PgaD [Granulosicoccaceae bacterium]|jgi:biofilm PGA synthesis protein PgaD
MSELIIETPHLQNLRQRYGFATLTLVFWMLWLYLWLPMISLVAWLFGINVFYYHMIELGGYLGFLKLLGWYTVTVLAIAVVYGSWMLVNIFRFRGKDKRRPVEHVTDAQVAEFFRLEPAFMSRFEASRSVIVYQAADGQIIDVASSQA